MINSNNIQQALPSVADINTEKSVFDNIISQDILINNLFRSCLIKDGSSWKVLNDQINKGVNPINKMADPQQNQFFVKEIIQKEESPIGEVSRAAMIRFYLGGEKTTEYMIMRKDNDNKQYVASKEVADSMTLYQYIQTPKIDQEEFQEFKETFKKKYKSSSVNKDLNLFKFGLNRRSMLKSIDYAEYEPIINHIINDQEKAKDIYIKIKICKKYKDFFIKKIIEKFEDRSFDLFRTFNGKPYDIYDLVANEHLISSGIIYDEHKEKIKQFYNENLDGFSIGLINQQLFLDYCIELQVLEALGGPDSLLVKEYIKLELANLIVGNRDAHYKNILVKLDEEGKAQGLVAIDFDSTFSDLGLRDYNKIKKVLDCVRPGMVQRIEDEFKQSMQQPRKLHDLLELLGAKEEEYRMLNNIEVSSTKFQDMINRAMNEGAVKSI